MKYMSMAGREGKMPGLPHTLFDTLAEARADVERLARENAKSFGGTVRQIDANTWAVDKRATGYGIGRPDDWTLEYYVEGRK